MSKITNTQHSSLTNATNMKQILTWTMFASNFFNHKRGRGGGKNSKWTTWKLMLVP